MTDGIVEGLATLTRLLAADAAVAWMPRGPASSAVVAAWPPDVAAAGDAWPAVAVPAMVATADMPPTVDASVISQVVPTGFRLSLPGPVLAVWAAPLGDDGSGCLAVWWQGAPSAAPQPDAAAFASGPLREVLRAHVRRATADADAARLAAVTSTLPQALVFVDDGGGFGRLNAAAAALLDLPEGEVPSPVIGPALRRLRMQATEPERLEAEARQLLPSPDSRISDWRWEFHDRLPSDLRVSSAPVSGNAARGRMWVLDDISKEMNLVRQADEARAVAEAAQAELAASEERFRMAMQGSASGMLIADADGTVVTVNPALCALVGRAEAELLGTSWFDLATDERSHGVRLRNDVQAGRIDNYRLDTVLRRSQGTSLLADTSVAAVRRPDGSVAQVVVQFSDVTAVRASFAEMTHRAGHDTLTGLVNRTLLQERLNALLAVPEGQRDGGSGTLVGVLFCDLDGFKSVNDTLGHAAGDTVLVHVADRLRSSVRSSDIVARLGGDEFVVVTPAVSDVHDVLAVAEKIRIAVRRPIDLGDDHVTTVGVSIGVCVAPVTTPADDLMATADAAVYRAKEAGRDRVVSLELGAR